MTLLGNMPLKKAKAEQGVRTALAVDRAWMEKGSSLGETPGTMSPLLASLTFSSPTHPGEESYPGFGVHCSELPTRG